MRLKTLAEYLDSVVPLLMGPVPAFVFSFFASLFLVLWELSHYTNMLTTLNFAFSSFVPAFRLKFTDVIHQTERFNCVNMVIKLLLPLKKRNFLAVEVKREHHTIVRIVEEQGRRLL